MKCSMRTTYNIYFPWDSDKTMFISLCCSLFQQMIVFAVLVPLITTFWCTYLFCCVPYFCFVSITDDVARLMLNLISFTDNFCDLLLYFLLYFTFFLSQLIAFILLNHSVISNNKDNMLLMLLFSVLLYYYYYFILIAFNKVLFSLF